MEVMTKNVDILANLNLPRLKNAARVLRALNHPLRLNIVTLISDNESLTVTQIYFKLRIEQSVASQHLAILRESEILTANRAGKNIFYSLNQDRIKAIKHCLNILKS